MVLATAPAGLGHVRVTEALRDGLGKEMRAEVVGLQDASVQILHRLASRTPFLRSLMEFAQNNPLVEEHFSRLYRANLRRGGKEAYQRLVELVKRRRPIPKVLVIVATHFALAHQVAAVKRLLAQELNLCVVLAVVVTDDSPQKMWGVVGADYVFVPSSTTKERLEAYMRRVGGELPEVVISAYPVSPGLCKNLSEDEFNTRRSQVSPRKMTRLELVIPISGAAVQLRFFQELISVLGKNGKADITVISRESGYTKSFLSWCQERPSVRVIAEALDWDVVTAYEKEYERMLFSVEVTKPSEQTFKALITPKQRGGVILLFSEPVGRQEDDNIAFLARHGLLPSLSDQQLLFRLWAEEEGRVDAEFLRRARRWRGILLPSGGLQAGKAILWLRKHGVLASMVEFSEYMDHPELRGDGVGRFWRKLARRVGEKCGIG